MRNILLIFENFVPSITTYFPNFVHKLCESVCAVRACMHASGGHRVPSIGKNFILKLVWASEHIKVVLQKTICCKFSQLLYTNEKKTTHTRQTWNQRLKCASFSRCQYRMNSFCNSFGCVRFSFHWFIFHFQLSRKSIWTNISLLWTALNAWQTLLLIFFLYL